MKKLSPLFTQKEAARLAGAKGGKQDLRIGQYYTTLPKNNKDRFNRIAGSLARRYDLALNKYPAEMLLIRQIAMDTLKIEELELHLLNNPQDKWVSMAEKWLLLAKKERRETISTLSTLVKVTEKTDKVVKFDDLRNVLRVSEDLPESTTKMSEDGHKRRYFDKVTRTK